MASSNFSKIPTEVVENWAQYLEASDLSSFRLACRQADAQTLHTVAQRFFSTWRTSLMASDLRKLEDISMNADLRKYVKNIHIEDDCERNDAELLVAAPLEVPWTGLPHVWPRDDAQIVNASEIGATSLRAMFMEKRFHPETIKIRDYRKGNATASPEPATTLARSILDGADLAVVSIRIHKESQSVIEATVRLSPQHQGQDVGFSLLSSAELCFASNDASYWSEQLFYHAPALEDLTLSFDKPWSAQHGSMFSVGKPNLQLIQLNLSMSTLPAHIVLTILANSKHNLTGVSFSLMKLSQGSTWRELLSSIGSDFPRLTSFNLKFLSEEESGAIKFQGLSKDRVDKEYGLGLEMFERGPQDNRRISWVRYKGPAASSVLKVVASTAVTW
ncbi:hypothetical protein K505DRAFT_358666 [Melanomma pulvis-pyrius CBS 109.77]|uniref:F-box domain-containing protein n=1 Tax=Melanomma pulvis-pyrius CBS 109.77 TaxID=1314802 RepID=A0A6A6XNL8_9PLEO|nr:hypothetical protein K505DRAFT_358666 [Melanomma pulvis-pyrius CBS 109.77]